MPFAGSPGMRTLLYKSKEASSIAFEGIVRSTSAEQSSKNSSEMRCTFQHSSPVNYPPQEGKFFSDDANLVQNIHPCAAFPPEGLMCVDVKATGLTA